MEKKVPKIALAYDKSTCTDGDISELRNIISDIGVIKLGLESITAPSNTLPCSVADYVTASLGREKIVLDIKLHDIPNTVEAAMRNLAGKYRGVTLHASMGPSGLKAAAKGRREILGPPGGIAPDDTALWTIAFAVTVLTSHDESECLHIFGYQPKTKVLQFAYDCIEAGIDGLVCSGQELEALQNAGIAHQFTTFVPGGRPAWASAGDQKRVLTPGELARLGADYVVIGRPILKGPYSPADAVRRINFEMEDALAA